VSDHRGIGGGVGGAVAGDDVARVELLHLGERLGPGGALADGGGVRGPHMQTGEEQHPADDRAAP